MPASKTIGSAIPAIKEWFAEPGAYVLVDGQYGSTGKGLFAATIALTAENVPNIVTTNQGPNSGHTAHWGDRVCITKQFPVSSVVYRATQETPPLTYLNAGAIIDRTRLINEANGWFDGVLPLVHPCAAIVSDRHRDLDENTVSSIASTGQGVGPALADKIARDRNDPAFLARHVFKWREPPAGRSWDNFWDWSSDRVFVETAQGFSLGVNSGFYPYVTSRECTVMQAISDARIPAQMVRRVAMCVRTYPIRVGNVGSTSSGDCYGDQLETSWEELGLAPELTTVTKRVRRVFTWSRQQFRDAVAANRPDVIFVNFMNYLPQNERGKFVTQLFDDYMSVMNRMPICYYGFGPRVEDVTTRYW